MFMGGSMRQTLRCGVATGVLCALFLAGQANVTAARATTMDEVLQRLQALEKSNAKLEKENRSLRKAVGNIESGKGVKIRAVAAEPTTTRAGNPVGHFNVATSSSHEPLVGIAGMPIITKSGNNPFLDATTVDIYGYFNVSAQLQNAGVWDQNTMGGVSSNNSYLGFKIRHDLNYFGYPGFAFVGQLETEADISSTPSVKASLGSRNSFVGIESPWGSIEAGKYDTPYKESTVEMDPFYNTVGGYNSIMGNTGGDGRAEFAYRAPHAVWYVSPVLSGFQVKAMVSPGQNQGISDSAFPFGEYSCSGGPAIGNGSGFPGNNQGQAFDTGGVGGEYCNDGSFGTLYSASLTYHGNGITGIVAAEGHLNVNRTGDIFNPDGTNIVLPSGTTVTGSGIDNEWAVKVGGGYGFNDGIGKLQLYLIGEHMEADGIVSQFNERNQNDIFFSAKQSVGPWDFAFSYIHSFGEPGSPTTLTVPYTATAANPGGTQYDTTGLNSSASQYTAGVTYNFSKWASVYLVGTDLVNGPGAHACLGPSSLGYSICGRDAYNNTYGGNSIWATAAGFILKF